MYSTNMRRVTCLRWGSLALLLVACCLVATYWFASAPTRPADEHLLKPIILLGSKTPVSYYVEASTEPSTETTEADTEPSAETTASRIPRRCPLETQASRKQHLQEWCRRNEVGSTSFMLDKNQLDSIYVNDEYKIVYCRIPKTGCTNWKKYLILLSGKTNHTRINDIKGDDAHHDLFESSVRQLSTYSREQRAHILRNYFKFTIVRHPLTRLLSAYNNKLSQTNTVFETYNRIVLRYSNRSNLSPDSRASLVDFLRFLTDPSGHNLLLNAHWQNFHELCQPCQISYDFVGHVETMPGDSEAIVQRIGAPYPFPSFQPASDSRINEAFRNVSNQLINRVIEKYKDDFQAFGYDC